MLCDEVMDVVICTIPANDRTVVKLEDVVVVVEPAMEINFAETLTRRDFEVPLPLPAHLFVC